MGLPVLPFRAYTLRLLKRFPQHTFLSALHGRSDRVFAASTKLSAGLPAPDALFRRVSVVCGYFSSLFLPVPLPIAWR